MRKDIKYYCALFFLGLSSPLFSQEVTLDDILKEAIIEHVSKLDSYANNSSIESSYKRYIYIDEAYALQKLEIDQKAYKDRLFFISKDELEKKLKSNTIDGFIKINPIRFKDGHFRINLTNIEKAQKGSDVDLVSTNSSNFKFIYDCKERIYSLVESN